MARIRTIKPEFFQHELLFEAECETGLPLRLSFIGLWTQADREGRFKWRPRALKLNILPYDDIDFSRVLHALVTRGFIVKYASEGEPFGYIPNFRRHQAINHRESASELPNPEECQTLNDASPTCAARDNGASGTRRGHARGEGKGREGGKDASTTRGSRLEDSWTLPEEWRQWAIAQGHPDPEAAAERFRDYWCAKPGEKGRKTDWQATWRNWVRRDLENHPPAGDGRRYV